MRRALCAAATLLALGPAPARDVTASDGTVLLRVQHSRFHPSTVRVAAGSRVRFVVQNTDPIGHELIIGGPAVQLRHERGTEAHHGGRDGEISVPAGSIATTSYTFESPGRFLMGCHLPGHYAYGMRGLIQAG